jgi:hypothetical protein
VLAGFIVFLELVAYDLLLFALIKFTTVSRS